MSDYRVQTTISINGDLRDFVKKFNINLSEFVRNKLEELRKRYKKEGLIDGK